MLGSELEFKGAEDCAFCQLGRAFNKADFVIWVQGSPVERDKVTGLHHTFKVYRQRLPAGAGLHAEWQACFDHAYQAEQDMMRVIRDELITWGLDDRWMEKRNGRI